MRAAIPPKKPETYSSQQSHSSLTSSSPTSTSSTSSHPYTLPPSSQPLPSKRVPMSSPMSSPEESAFHEVDEGVRYEIDPETGPAPVLPPGYDAEGRKMDHSSVPCSGEEEGHPELGPGPPTPPIMTSVGGVFSQSDLVHSSVEDTLTPTCTSQQQELVFFQNKMAELQCENEQLRVALELKDNQIQQIRKEWEADVARLIEENRHLRELESHRQVLQNSGRATSQLRSPVQQPVMYPAVNQRRQGELLWNPSSSFDRRISEPVMTLTVPQASRPKNLPLSNGQIEASGCSSVDSGQHHSWDGIPLYAGGYTGHSPDNVQRTPLRSQSSYTPSSDYPRDSSNPHHSRPRLSGSIDDLITEDRLSLQSNGSGGKGGFYLPSVRNTPATFV